MISDELLRAIRNDLPIKVMILRLGRQGPHSKHFAGYFRFLCPSCGELRATVDPRNNLAHCFACDQNFNNIDLLIALGYDFLAAVETFEQWLRQHCERHTARSTQPAAASNSMPNRSHRSYSSDRCDVGLLR